MTRKWSELTMHNTHRVNQQYYFSHLLIATMLFVIGCDICYASGTAIKNQDQKSFYIDIGKTAETNLLRKVRSLKRGASVEEAKAIVGEPTEDKMLIGKKGEFHARLLRYYIRQLDTGVNEIHDRYVSLYFDQANKLMSIGYKLTGQIESETYDEPR